MYFNQTLFSDDLKPIEVEIICEKCGKCISIKELNIFEKIRSEYCIVGENRSIECECGNKSGSGILEFKKGTIMPKLSSTNSTLNTPKCPTCGSTNLKRISNTEKVTNVALFGLFGNKRKHQWHCNSCKSDF